MGYITKGKIMKNFLKLLSFCFFGLFAASDIEASTSGYLNTYNYGGVSTTIGSIGSSNVYLNTYDYGGVSTTIGSIGSSSVYSTTYNSGFNSSTYMYID